MNKIFTLIIFLSGLFMTAQVGIGTANPDPAAALDINSQLPDGNYGGLKLPTMTIAQRATIPSPIPDGLMVYIFDGAIRCVQIYDATQSSWMNWYCMNQLPVASAVSFSGTTEVGETLTGSYTYTDVENDPESGTSFQWYRATDASGTGITPIAGATSLNYVTTINDGNQFVAIGVTPQASSGASPGAEVSSSYQQISFLQTLVEFDRNATTIPEGDSRTIPILITNPNPSNATTVEINLDGGNTSTFGALGTTYTIDNDGTNVTAYPFTVTIPAGVTTFNNVTITVAQDDNNAINEELYVILQNPNGGTNAVLSGVQDDHVVYSDDDEFPTEVEFVTTSSSIEEPLTPGNTSTIDIAITNPNATASTTVVVSLNASSTVEPGDYTIDYDGSSVTFPFTVTFPAGQTANESFTVTSLNDPDASDELLNMELTSPAGGIATAILGANDSHDLTINDDDVATVVEFATSTFSINEDDVDTITINLSNPSATVATTVEVAIGGSSTVAGAGVDFDIDYASTTVASYPFTVTFPAGVTSQTIDLYAFDDVNTANETLILNLQNVSGGFLAQLGTNITNTVTINDDDAPLFTEMQQDFDSNTNWSFVSNPTPYNLSNDVWAVTSSLTSITTLTNNFWGMRDLNNGNGGGNFLHTLTFADVDLSSANNVTFSFDYESQDLNANGDRYGYELIYDGVSQGQVDLCNGCNANIQGTISLSIPNTVSTFSVIMYGRFDGGSDIAAWDNFRLYE